MFPWYYINFQIYLLNWAYHGTSTRAVRCVSKCPKDVSQKWHFTMNKSPKILDILMKQFFKSFRLNLKFMMFLISCWLVVILMCLKGCPDAKILQYTPSGIHGSTSKSPLGWMPSSSWTNGYLKPRLGPRRSTGNPDDSVVDIQILDIQIKGSTEM